MKNSQFLMLFSLLLLALNLIFMISVLELKKENSQLLDRIESYIEGKKIMLQEANTAEYVIDSLKQELYSCENGRYNDILQFEEAEQKLNHATTYVNSNYDAAKFYKAKLDSASAKTSNHKCDTLKFSQLLEDSRAMLEQAKVEITKLNSNIAMKDQLITDQIAQYEKIAKKLTDLEVRQYRMQSGDLLIADRNYHRITNQRTGEVLSGEEFDKLYDNYQVKELKNRHWIYVDNLESAKK